LPLTDMRYTPAFPKIVFLKVRIYSIKMERTPEALTTLEYNACNRCTTANSRKTTFI
jgi:hypothetical protein